MKKELPGVQSFPLSSIESILTHNSKHQEESNIKGLTKNKIKIFEKENEPKEAIQPSAITR